MKVLRQGKIKNTLIIEMTQEEYQHICYLVEKDNIGKVIVDDCFEDKIIPKEVVDELIKRKTIDKTKIELFGDEVEK